MNAWTPGNGRPRISFWVQPVIRQENRWRLQIPQCPQLALHLLQRFWRSRDLGRRPAGATDPLRLRRAEESFQLLRKFPRKLREVSGDFLRFRSVIGNLEQQLAGWLKIANQLQVVGKDRIDAIRRQVEPCKEVPIRNLRRSSPFQQGDTMKLVWRGNTRERCQGGQHIHEGDRLRHTLPLGYPWPGDDERHVDNFIEQCVAMGESALFQKLVAMIREEHDNRVVPLPGIPQVREQTPQLFVHIAEFCIVEIAQTLWIYHVNVRVGGLL